MQIPLQALSSSSKHARSSKVLILHLTMKDVYEGLKGSAPEYSRLTPGWRPLLIPAAVISLRRSGSPPTGAQARLARARRLAGLRLGSRHRNWNLSRSIREARRVSFLQRDF